MKNEEKENSKFSKSVKNGRSSDKARTSKKRSHSHNGSKSNFDSRSKSDCNNQQNGSPSGVVDPKSAMSSLNDISWYTRYPELIAATASIPFPYRPGMVIKDVGVSVMQSGDSTSVSAAADIDIPGVLSLDWMPSVGKSSTVLDAASVAGKELYARVRAAYSGSLQADAPDFVIYLMALDSIFSYIGMLKRVYRVLNAYSPDNYFVSDGILTAMGFSQLQITSMRRSKMAFWGMVDDLILMSRKFTCPAVMDIFNRHYWLNENVYTDAPTPNSQFYLFRQVGFYKYMMLPTPDDVLAGGLGMMLFNTASFGNDPIAGLHTFGNDLISALATSEDGYTISGYLKRAFEGSPDFVVDEQSQDDTLVPVYVEEVLSQIENSKAVPVPTKYAIKAYSFDVTQDPKTNVVLSSPSVTVSSTPYTRYEPHKMFITSRSDAPTAGDNVIATRLMTVAEQDATDPQTYNITCATEALLRYGLTRWRQSKGTFVTSDLGGYLDVNIKYNTYDNGFTPYMLMLDQWDWHPIIPVGIMNNTDTEPTTAMMGDIHNASVITKEDLVQMHRVCTLSEFNAFN